MTDLTTLTRELEEARKDLDLFTRLTSAAERVNTLEADVACVRAASDKAEQEEADREREALFAGISNLRVVDEGTADDSDDVLWRGYKITWLGRGWNTWLGRDEPREYTVQGFRSLPENVMLYLIERAPDQIPPRIRALAPGDAREALSLYFRARHRGHL